MIFQYDEPKPFLDHLEDLRWVLIKCVAALTIAMAVCFWQTKLILSWLQWPLVQVGHPELCTLRVLGVVDPLTIDLNIALFGGVILSLPFMLYYIGTFILPALDATEKRFLIPAFTAGGLLFLGGVAFCYFLILPQTLEFFIDYNKRLGVQTEWTLQNYIDFIVQMLVGFGLSFELPLIIILLHMIGIITSELLANYRRHAFMCILFIAACVTPTSDPFTLGMMTAPMYLLYEVTIWITKWRELQAK